MIRRTFLSRLGLSAAIFGVRPAHSGDGDRSAEATAAQSSDARFQPARHSIDDWFEQVPGKHRFFFDTLSPKGVDEALLFATNYFNASKTAYELESPDLAVVICLRHRATLFAFNDGVWAKYGAGFAENLDIKDPKTNQTPTVNIHSARFAAAIKRGVHFAVCNMATHAFSGMAARKLGIEPDEAYKEFTANTVGNAHFVPAGIVAVNRAQEHGYSFAYVG